MGLQKPAGPALFLFLVLAAGPLVAQEAQDTAAEESEPPIHALEDYLAPPPEILDAVTAPRWENVELDDLNPSGEWFLRTVEDGFPSLATYAKRHYDLASFQIDPAANRERRLTLRSDAGYEVISADGERRVRIDVPDGARVTSAEWAPDGSRLAFLAHFDDATHVYVADPASGDSRRVTDTPVLATMVTGVEWTADGRRLATVILPEDRGPEPARPDVPETPMVRITTDEENRLRTYFDLLENPYEKELVEYYATGQLAVIDVESGDVATVGEPAMIEDIDLSPDGEHIRVTRVRKPFSYIVPVRNAGDVEELWNAEGEVLATLDENDLRDGSDRRDTRSSFGDDGEEERRGLTWQVDGPGLVYLQMEPRPEEDEDEDADAAEPEEQEAEDEEEEKERKDRLMLWHPPFDSTSTEVLYETDERIRSFGFDESGRIVFFSRGEGGGFFSSGSERVTALFLDEPDQEYEIYDHDGEELTEDPGNLMRTAGPHGRSVVRTSPDGASVYLDGTQYFEDPMEDAPRPFLDRVEIRTGETERLFQSAEDVYESVEAVLNDEVTRIVVTRESPTMIPDSWLVDLETGEREKLTDNVDHTPEITGARREVLMIERPDGFKSKVEVTLPADYREGTALPAMFWFYPREYTEQEGYDERNLARYNKNGFPGVGSRSMEILTLRGYAVVDPDLPVVGDDGQMNNNYVQDIRNTLSVVIDTLAARGWIDRDRLGIGGHSYGAFGTANAMVHTPFFKAGIAGDGNYNRSLTPAGFQTERRMLWEADQIYIEMSPFFKADQLTGALLMYHGMDDHNVGTHPTHSIRFFHALNVLGKTASLYHYPFEGHGPATRETVLDLWARWVSWLDTYVKNAGMEPEPMATEEGSSGG